MCMSEYTYKWRHLTGQFLQKMLHASCVQYLQNGIQYLWNWIWFHSVPVDFYMMLCLVPVEFCISVFIDDVQNYILRYFSNCRIQCLHNCIKILASSDPQYNYIWLVRYSIKLYAWMMKACKLRNNNKEQQKQTWNNPPDQFYYCQHLTRCDFCFCFVTAVREDRMPGGRNSGAVYNLYKVRKGWVWGLGISVYWDWWRGGL